MIVLRNGDMMRDQTDLSFTSRVQPAAVVNQVADHPLFTRWQPKPGSGLYLAITAWIAARNELTARQTAVTQANGRVTALKRQLAIAQGGTLDQIERLTYEHNEALAAQRRLINRGDEAAGNLAAAAARLQNIVDDLEQYQHLTNTYLGASDLITPDIATGSTGDRFVLAASMRDALARHGRKIEEQLGYNLVILH